MNREDMQALAYNSILIGGSEQSKQWLKDFFAAKERAAKALLPKTDKPFVRGECVTPPSFDEMAAMAREDEAKASKQVVDETQNPEYHPDVKVIDDDIPF